MPTNERKRTKDINLIARMVKVLFDTKMQKNPETRLLSYSHFAFLLVILGIAAPVFPTETFYLIAQ